MGRGLTLALSNGQTVFGLPDSFSFFGGGTLFGISVPIIVTVIVFTIMHFVLAHTVFGHEVYAIGGNREAARLAGINVRRVEMLVYTLGWGSQRFCRTCFDRAPQRRDAIFRHRSRAGRYRRGGDRRRFTLWREREI